MVTFAVVLVVVLLGLLAVAGLRLAQMRSVPLGVARERPAQGAGPTEVEVSADAWVHPAGPAVQDVLNRYFSAINDKDYRSWVATVTPAVANQRPEATWLQGYASITDGTIRVSRIDEAGPGRLVALVSYVSTQNATDGPDDLKVPRICWRSSIPLVGSPPLIDMVKTSGVLRGSC